jgi:surface-anchored protein
MSLVGTASAQVVYTYTTGHADIGIGYEDGVLVPHWHINDETEYEPGQVLAVISSTLSSPTGSAAALGVSDGSTVWVCGKAAYQPNLGFGAEELVADDWVNGTITLSLTGWSGPGEVGIFLLNSASTIVSDTVFSTHSASATGANNSLAMYAGDHTHLTFAFTEVGDYSLTFTWTGVSTSTGDTISESGTFNFSAVPEPSTCMLGLLAVAVLGAHRLRRLRSA